MGLGVTRRNLANLFSSCYSNKAMKKSILAKAKELHKLYHQGKIPTLEVHEVYPDLPLGSRERYLYFTLAPSLNFQRISTSMWQSALATWNDPQTNYLFFPEKVADESYEKIQADLTKHKLALQKNRHTDIWTKLCATLVRDFDADPRNVIASQDGKAGAIIDFIRNEKKRDFPYLSGPKLSNYWLYILSQYTDVELSDMHAISIIPDTHVLQATVELGLANERPTPAQAEELWHTLLAGEKLSPVEMHPVLWNWSRNGFEPGV